METLRESTKRQKIYYDIRNDTKQVLEIGDIVVKEIQKNISQKGGRLKKRIEKEFFIE